METRDTKKITVVKPAGDGNAESDAYDMHIAPGDTPNSILLQISGLAGYSLCKKDGTPLDGNADLFPQVEEGEKVFAATKATVGA